MSDKRKLTPFLAREMLFDYAMDMLDADRKAAVEEFIQTDKESQNLLEAIHRGISYANSLKGIELTDETLSELDQSENLMSLSKRLARWSEWPDSLRWSIMALGISFCTAAFVVLVPWKTIPLFRTGPTFDSSSIEMARVEPRKAGGEDPSLASNMPEEEKDDSGPLEGSGDEEFSEEASGAIPAQPPVVIPPVAVATPAAPAATPVPAATPSAVATSKATPVPKPTVAPVVAAAPSTKASRSFVYRAFMTLGELEDLAPKITQQIKELGAEKAGEVELGWRRGSGRYYHFTIPEANEQKLLENLRVYGPVRISKDPHPRVMPEGQVRFILWIESGS